VLRFRGGLVFKAHRLCVSLNSRLESNKEEEERNGGHLVLGGSARRTVSGALEFGQFEPSWLFPSGVASFLGEFLDLVSSRNRDAFLNPSRTFDNWCSAVAASSARSTDESCIAMVRTSSGPKALEPSCSRAKRVPEVDSSFRLLKVLPWQQ